MQRHARRQLITQLRDFGNGEDPARLVLHAHHRDKRCGTVLQLLGQLLHVEAAIRRIDVAAIPIKVASHAANGSGHRRMLQRGGDDLARVLTLSQARPAYGQVIRLRRAGREVDLVGVHAKHIGDGCAALLEHFLGATPYHMRRRRVAPAVHHDLVHARKHLGIGRRCCGVVQICKRLVHGHSHRCFVSFFSLILTWPFKWH